MTEPWIEFAPIMTTREAVALEPTAHEVIAPSPRPCDHLASGALMEDEAGDNPASVLIAICYREGLTYCAATQPSIARQFAADIIEAADRAEGKVHG